MINETALANNLKMDFQWHYTNATDRSAIARFNGHEFEVIGNFGESTLVINSKNYEITAEKITFKFDAEH